MTARETIACPAMCLLYAASVAGWAAWLPILFAVRAWEQTSARPRLQPADLQGGAA